MRLTVADHVWNRAALRAGGDTPGPGDRALTSLLAAHGLVMNGGVHHAIEVLNPAELIAAIEGYSFFGLDKVASFLRDANSDPVLSECTDDTEPEANCRYASMVPDDDHLVSHFERVFRERPDWFSPIDDAQ
jgi:hypothetical protein